MTLAAFVLSLVAVVLASLALGAWVSWWMAVQRADASEREGSARASLGVERERERSSWGIPPAADWMRRPVDEQSQKMNDLLERTANEATEAQAPVGNPWDVDEAAEAWEEIERQAAPGSKVRQEPPG